MSSVAHWYQLTVGSTGQFTWIQEPLRDAAGEIVPLFVELDAPLYLRASDARPVGDIARILGHKLIVSERALQVMRRCQFDEAISQRPVYISQQGSKVQGALYYWLASHTIHEVLHESLSVFSRSPVTGKPLVISKWVLSKNKIPAYDLFVGNVGMWLCSDLLRNMILDSGLTNFGFEPVQIASN